MLGGPVGVSKHRHQFFPVKLITGRTTQSIGANDLIDGDAAAWTSLDGQLDGFRHGLLLANQLEQVEKSLDGRANNIRLGRLGRLAKIASMAQMRLSFK